MTGQLVLDAYVRVSQVGQRAGESFISPSVQREQIAAWAKLRDVVIAETFEDLDVTGGKLRRPELDKLMARIRSGQTGGIVVAKLDRLSRASVIDALKLVEEIAEHGGKVAAVDLGIDPTTTFGEFALTIMLALARMERRRIAESWDVATERAIARGVHFTNSVPLGYLRGEDGRLVPNPETAPVVAEMFRRRIARHSWGSIAWWLTETIPREDGRPWSSRNVATMIQSPTYKGVAHHGVHRNPDGHPGIVTLPEWDAANATAGGPGAVKGSSALLAGLVRCAGCRYAMRRTWVRYKLASGETRKVEIYSCQRKHTGGECQAPAHVVAHLIEPIVIHHFGLWHFWNERPGVSPDLGAVQEAERQLADAERRLADVMADDALREAAPAAHLVDVRRRQRVVTDATATLEGARTRVQLDASRPVLLMHEWDGFDVETRRQLLQTALDAVYVRKGHSSRDGDLEDRVWLRWAGEDDLERPQRGNGRYVTKPIPWPTDRPNLVLANVPKWANTHEIPSEIAQSLGVTAAQGSGASPAPD